MRHLSTLVRVILLAFMVFLSGVLMLKSSPMAFPTEREMEDLTAGYSYLRFLDYRLDAAHPPLGKILEAAPLFVQKMNFPKESLNWQKDINGATEVSQQFFYESGNDQTKMTSSGRGVSIFLTLILIPLLYLVARELMGKWWALLPPFLFAFFPALLAAGQIADGRAAENLFFFLAVTTFLLFLNRPAKKHLLLAGITFGLAQLTTFAALILIPFFLFILLIFYLAGVRRDFSMTEPHERFRRFSLRAWRYARALFIIFLVGFLLVFLCYLLFTIKYPIEKQESDTAFILDQFQSQLRGSAIIWLSSTPILRGFGHYLLGLSFNSPDIAGLNLLTSAVTRAPLALLGMAILALAFSLLNIARALLAIIKRRSRKLSDYLNTNFSEFAMLIFVFVYWTAAMMRGIMDLAGVLATLPFIFILIASGIKKWAAGAELEKAGNLVLKVFIIYEEFIQISLKSAVLAALVIGYFVTALIVYPNFDSFSNLIAGKPNGVSDISDFQL